MRRSDSMASLGWNEIMLVPDLAAAAAALRASRSDRKMIPSFR